jgi:hypothetical protein
MRRLAWFNRRLQYGQHRGIGLAGVLPASATKQACWLHVAWLRARSWLSGRDHRQEQEDHEYRCHLWTAS